MDNRIPGTDLMKLVPRKLNAEFVVLSESFSDEEYHNIGNDLGLWFDSVFAELEDRPNGLTDHERAFVDGILSAAWRKAVETHGPDHAAWHTAAIEQYRQKLLPYHQDLAGFPSLHPDFDLPEPDLYDNEQLTMLSQQGQSYSQSVSLDNPDAALALLPIGVSERPGSPYRLSTYQLWAEGKFHPAPLSRGTVDRIATQRVDLSCEYSRVQ